MIYKFLIILHLLGASTWIGGHVVLLGVVLPRALRERSASGILEFERGYGRIGLAALGMQTVTGLWLATRWLGGPDGWRTLFSSPTPIGHLVLTKLGLLAVNVSLAAHVFHRVLPHMAGDNLRPFAIHAWIVTLVSVAMLIVGASFRSGGLF